MNKRIIAVCLCCLLLFSVISMPARADEYSADGCYVDLIDLAGYRVETIPLSGYSRTVGFYLENALPSGILAFDFEICIVASGAEPVLTSINPDVDFTVSNTVNGFFVRGSFDGQRLSDIELNFTADSECNFAILSFKIYLQRYLFSNFAATVSSGYSTLPLTPGSSVTVASAPIESGVSTPVNYSIKVSKTYWADMDYMEFSFTLKCLSIDTISAYSTADNYLPIDINYVEQGYNPDGTMYDDNWFYVSGSIDLTSMDDVNTTGDIQILISCVGGSPQSVLTVTGLRGIHYSGLFNTDSVFFNTLIMALATFNEYVITSVDAAISNLGQLVSSGFDSILAYFNDTFMPDLKEFWIAIESDVYKLFENLFYEVNDRLDKLYDVLAPDPVDQDVTDQMQQAGSELGGMTDQMQQASPNISPDDVNVDVGALVDPTAMSSATVLLTVVTGVPFVQQVLLIVASFALIGFVFFGKR